MATTIKWIDNNKIETAHRIYKSSTYFTKDNLPAPLVELGPDVTEYVDSAGTDGENWYIVSALLNDYEVFSEPFISGLSTAYIHDVFGDGSAVATYQFDGDATDLGGNYNGTWVGTESYSSGIIGQAANFDGVSGVAIPDDQVLDNPNNTYSAWVQTVESSGSMAVIKSGGSGSGHGICVSDGYASINSTGDDYIESGVTITDGGWHHLVITWDGTTAKLYVDGIESASSTTYGGDGSDSDYIGYSEETGTTNPFIGSITQVRIFNRALTQAEVDTLYQEGANFL